MISQFFILSPRGDAIVTRDYLGDVPKARVVVAGVEAGQGRDGWRPSGLRGDSRWARHARCSHPPHGPRPHTPTPPPPPPLQGAAETFLRRTRFWGGAGGGAPPCFAVDGVHYLSVADGGVILLATTRVNASPSLILELLRRLAGVIRDCCGVLSEDAVRKNFVLVYELLDEVIDHGWPQAREAG